MTHEGKSLQLSLKHKNTHHTSIVSENYTVTRNSGTNPRSITHYDHQTLWVQTLWKDPVTHNITHSPCTSTCTALPITLPSTTLLCTQLTNTKHICVNDGKLACTRCRDGVKVLWCHSHLVQLVFEGPIPSCTCFHSENIL